MFSSFLKNQRTDNEVQETFIKNKVQNAIKAAFVDAKTRKKSNPQKVVDEGVSPALKGDKNGKAKPP